MAIFQKNLPVWAKQSSFDLSGNGFNHSQAVSSYIWRPSRRFKEKIVHSLLPQLRGQNTMWSKIAKASIEIFLGFLKKNKVLYNLPCSPFSKAMQYLNPFMRSASCLSGKVMWGQEQGSVFCNIIYSKFIEHLLRITNFGPPTTPLLTRSISSERC